MRPGLAGAGPLPNGRAPKRPLFAVGDIHGHLDALEALLERLATVVEERHAGREVDLVFLGDLIDRGPDPIGCLRRAAKGLPGCETRLLLGNHDWYLAAAAGLRGARMTPDERWSWTEWGGAETLQAIGLSDRAARDPDAVRKAIGAEACVILEGMDLYFQSGRVLCVHAGLDPDLPLSQQSERDMMWIRGPFLRAGEDPEHPWPLRLTVVHGHTPDAWGIKPHRIGVDTGGYATGAFTAAEIAADGVALHSVLRD
ncbi:MAG: metallophosphoesterase family protein [Pseudomonadota bacterium]